jgi:two-component system LytT family response regulator
MKFSAVLVDDEHLALSRIERMLEEHRDAIEVVGTASDGAEAVRVINELRPDVVFLDVHMPELSGFDVLDLLEYNPLVVFSTAYDEYALKAFEVYSVDYLLKPVDPRRLKLAVDKLRRLSDGGGEERREGVRLAGEVLKSPDKYRIQVRSGDKIKLIPASDVVFFQASDKYVEVHTIDECHLISVSLTKLESELPPEDFARVHRSVIVNLNFIDEIDMGVVGAYEVRMKNAEGTCLPVSRRYKSRLNLS